MKPYTFLLLFVAATAVANTPPSVTHLHAQQRPNSQLVDITYSVVDSDNDPLTISVQLLSGNGALILQCTSVSGAVGGGIMPGNNKHIVWDAGADYPGQYGPDYTLRVVAVDRQAPPGFEYIAPGTFTMGSPSTEPGRLSDETQHSVTLNRGFYMSKHEVTEQLWFQVMGGTPTASQLPKVFVSWDMAVQFCNALSLQEGLTPAYSISGSNGNATWNQSANGYRLPTEAEWEYACRSGSTTAFANGPIAVVGCGLDPNLNAMGWYCGNSSMNRHAVGLKLANSWGLYDMHGNVFEWCWDRYGAYPPGASTDPVGSPTGAVRVIRGGDWNFYAQYCRSAGRATGGPTVTTGMLGFRLVRQAY